MSLNWVMLSREGDVVQLPNENIFYKKRSRIALELSTPTALPDAPRFSVKSSSGTLYITTKRVIYLPTQPTEQLKSFSAPVLNFEDTGCEGSLFSPWRWCGIVKPVVGGNIPPGIPRLEIKLTFKDGGHDAFWSAFNTMKGRLSYAREVQAETGQTISVDEDLPQYEAAISPPTTSATSAAREPPVSAVVVPPAQAAGSGPAHLNPPRPNEPPPGYEEAQAQAVGHRQEDRAERQ